MSSGYGNDPFGFGPYGSVEGVIVTPPNPPGLGYGGAEYGYGSYGSIAFPMPTPPISGGYGGCPYGLSSYGCIGSSPPRIVNAISLNGFQIELFFSEEMLIDADLTNPGSYTLNSILGAAVATVLSVDLGVMGTFGPTSVILNHTGTTLGGVYEIVAVGPKAADGGGNVEWDAPFNRTTVLCKGEPPAFTVTPISGTELLYQFDQDMLPESGFSPGIEDLNAYVFESTYPIPIIPQAVTFPYNLNNTQVKLDVIGMTSATYNAVVGPAEAIVYDATYLPTQSTEFQVQEIGSGAVTVGSQGLLVSKNLGDTYALRFADLSGKILPNSSFRCDVSFDVSASGAISPALGDTQFLSILVSDGAVGATMTLLRIMGVDFIEISSGGYFVSTMANWSSGPTTVSLVRNQKADTYTVVVNGEPIVSALTGSYTGFPGIPSGVQVTFDPVGLYQLTGFPFQGIRFTSTQTVFSAAWNFLHQWGSSFVGSSALTKNFLLTQKGPLVKGWGDATPATKEDVSVKINGVEVEIDSVNPYYGKIFLTIPIPLMPPGFLPDIDVDYIWFYNPVFVMEGLNTLGLVFNKYNPLPLCPLENSTDAPPYVEGGFESTEFSRFPYGLALNSLPIRQPLLRSPRFVGFQKSYTAALNSPTTLLLNRNNVQVALPDQERSPEGETVFYDATEDPTLSTPAWIQVGGGVGLEDTIPEDSIFANETFLLAKDEAGSFGAGVPYFFYRDVDFSFPSSFVYVVRFQVTDDIVLQPHGVFTGVGFGVHTNNHLYLVGCLLVNGVQHVGILVDPAHPEELDSWKLAYGVEMTILSATDVLVKTSDLPVSLQQQTTDCDADTQFQITFGSQAGVFKVIGIRNFADGTTRLTLDPSTPFPGDFTVFGGNYITGYFETRWDGNGEDNNSTTYRLIVQNDIKLVPKGKAELFIGGSLSGRGLVLEGAPPFAIPPDGILQYPTGEEGEVFWGSLDRQATNASRWNFVRYALQTGQTTINFRGIVAAAEMATLPENDPNNIWFLTQEFGLKEILPNPGDPRLLLKATSSNTSVGAEGLDLTIGYARIEPFLTRRLAIDVDSTFQVDSGVLGAGDAEILVRDGTKQVLLATLLYRELTKRELLYLTNISLAGLYVPTNQGWTKTGAISQEFVDGKRIKFGQELGETVEFTFDLYDKFGFVVDPGRIFEARFTVDSVTTTDPLGDTGIFFASDVGPEASSRGVGVELRTGGEVILFSLASGTEVASFSFDWEDQKEHVYRIVADANADLVSLVIDHTLIGSAPLSSFDFSSTAFTATFGFSNPLTECFVVMSDLSVCVMPPPDAKRTLGVWLGGDKSDINNWEIPRTDSLSVPNSDLSAVVEVMDWRSPTQVRIHRDPEWGVTILRPDLPPPPFFTGDLFASQITEPSAGWINVEYRHLPPVEVKDMFGFVSFGALEAASITQQRWEDVRYRIYEYASENIIAPHHMLFNQYNVITSGELNKDITVETAVVLSRNSSTIVLSDSAMYADQVFNISYVNKAGNTVFYYPPAIEFDKETQTITIVASNNLAFQPSQDLDDVEEEGVINQSLNDDNWPFDNIGELFQPDDDLEYSTNPNPPFLPDPVQVPVTVNFAPGKPLTLTYLCSQPLLDGTTLLNEGTPIYTKSLIGSFDRDVAFGSQVNDPYDLLNTDPDFILNDPFRYVEFTKAKPSEYENIEFCEVSEGDTCLLSIFCDNNVPGASSSPANGGASQPGDIGNGLIGLDLSGLAFTEIEAITFSDGPTGPFNAPLSSVFLKNSGGDADPGGYLQDAILFTGIGSGTPNPMGSDGNVGWSVFGVLYDTTTNTSTVLYFGTEAPAP